LNLAIGNGHEELRQIEARIEQLEDAVNWHDGANMENATAPNIPGAAGRYRVAFL
jgi:hypothetical protein